MGQQLQQLEAALTRLAADQPFALSWEIRPIGTGEVIARDSTRAVASFSTRKVSVLLACLALVKTGELSLEDRSVITEEMKDGVQAGIMRNLAAGISLNLRDSLVQMMSTSDNICTQLVFRAIGSVRPDPLQWVNDYCAWMGLHATLHREIFPRTGDLTWSHSLETLTTTTAQDQSRLLEKLGRGCVEEASATQLLLSRELCGFARDAMLGLFTPALGVSCTEIQFAEKNGRGLRSLSQVGLALSAAGAPSAAVAAYAENIPTELPSGVPGRVAAFDLFAEVGLAVQEWARGR
ncbi:serine hydrolase [Nesterenkonia lutea]|uniref:Beta-lactamase class A n=1 Tax=Nesterenkonia lutea TaxID=272919 RepID=A0ABR9JEJ7_9MICC|nr:serine hydrolase [Nesterenkonia lutea]MBE1524362.1 beta-lactamase class A [Nesterenkonia lutea]